MAPERSESVLIPKTCFNLKSTSIDFLLLILNNPNLTQRDFASISTHIEYFKIIKNCNLINISKMTTLTYHSHNSLHAQKNATHTYAIKNSYINKTKNLLNAGTAYHLLLRHSPTEIKGVVFSIRRACYNWHLTTFNRSHS